jgi:putative flippase GtrA
MAPEIQLLLSRFGRLGVVAVTSFLTNVLLTILLTEFFGLPPERSFALVLVLIFAANFIATRHWVFSDRVAGSNAWSQLLKCAAVSASFRVLEWVAFYVLLDYLDLHYALTLVGVLCLSFVTKSLIYERYVFR